MSEQAPTIVMVLAAGGGTRMRSKTMKVLHPLAGRTLLGHALHAARGISPEHVVAVIGNQREQVAEHLAQVDPDVIQAVQEEQLGTGHAVAVGLASLGDEAVGSVVVLYGDVPLLEPETLERFVEDHRQHGRTLSVLTAKVANPHGYGRVVRGADGGVVEIVEERDATDEQRRIDEINSGILAFDLAWAREALRTLGNDNAQGEYYLTDLIGLAVAEGREVGAYEIADAVQTEGVNTRVQLARLAAEANRRIVERHMLAGVSVVDPATTWIDVDVSIGPDTTILPGTQILGATSIGEDALIGPDCTLQDMEIGDGASVVRTHASLSVIEAEATVGPFSYLRPGTTVGAGGKLGAFVEAKNTRLAPGAKVPHLSYVGDGDIGEGANIGAGSIFANYDGVKKNRTTIGAHARISCNNTFVAPVSVGEGAFTGAGATIREDVPPGALAVSAGSQRTIEGWVARKRPGTPAAEAAARAAAGDQSDDAQESPT
ncbi:bifunctional UDP-N-acetylglucosamine diphosphorylase/glucosamine-1-phosphate N-acetyltransferase GlmU [Mumia sp. zg.B53]|uniref:bifunctional UDP-N-acetylglucosamine diphosphorylase/glucosamine-1-phosphate N-acetyltransferase GlmU n=1 Tax=unclassified Mumia TaxID=2621872 RepID=UPI001C6EF852|nr:MULTISPECIES: bifunctional UDP-N-acetylglucosamine diphosphorylase/glucosamine-1-phosphate N-acetyltransferase GlmU [unclassified Mumia]MBW9206917.1 bifunctional UDP-N-acetylglucosamine diphosphorylase/glucosamine-1-phosphate N-acetyltransferase GlmU [Mumia sp. zg.B17]MBW9215361.1 bifunctional UDP-N-acetylglucosamine diphosphorylase/glucosamine-1-phosphate N-acetyltransferase GlmU [Mumia sp. zg.B53]MDD9348373.1 bifunctional UDP-N-acetylglucosamine diphosphorylase/glucosamine-1-phosphate N-ace